MSTPPAAARRLGVVTDITNINASPPTVQIQLDGDTSNTIDANFVEPCVPVVGDMLVLLSLAGHHLIIGRVDDFTRRLNPVSFAANWQNFAGQTGLTYSRIGGLVIINGYIQRITAATVAGTTYSISTALPVGYRPVAPVFGLSLAELSATSQLLCRSQVDAAGVIGIQTPGVVAVNNGVAIAMSYVAEA